MFSSTDTGNAIFTLFIIGFTSSASGGNDSGSRDFLRFLVFGITSFFLVMVGEMKWLLKL